MANKMEIEHEYTDNVVCPYCGYEDEDSWELDDDSGETECGSCDKKFEYSRNRSVDYCTSKIQCEEGKHEYVFDSEHVHYSDFSDKIKKEEDWEFIEIQKCSICDDKIYTKTIPREDWIEKYPRKWEQYQDWIKRDRLKHGDALVSGDAE